MKSILVVLFSLICLALVAGYPGEWISTYAPETPTPPTPASTSSGEDEVYIQDRKVPDPIYEINALKAFKEAKALHPNLVSPEFLETFSKLFNDSHPVEGGWKVIGNFQFPYYNPNVDYIFIELRMQPYIYPYTIRIFNSK
ncbi:uncharacterized protein LOC126879826 [Diabrotica virgifera virgifera]|uniref:Uncharacterized protein n=1 Tax=Diabrotica virgifera virgifera TaxID=50390 RepID=A0ABM5JMB2_DIAVI|nr:uncharacterized protein LOC126879826 [Diabrotica virgifera virgifera]